MSCNLSKDGSDEEVDVIEIVGCLLSEQCRSTVVSWRGASCGVVFRMVSLLLRGTSVTRLREIRPITRNNTASIWLTLCYFSNIAHALVHY